MMVAYPAPNSGARTSRDGRDEWDGGLYLASGDVNRAASARTRAGDWWQTPFPPIPAVPPDVIRPFAEGPYRMGRHGQDSAHCPITLAGFRNVGWGSRV